MTFFVLCMTVVATGASEAAQPFQLKDGDRVILVGNTFIERDRFYGRLETTLRSRAPDVKFTVRNLGWPGDTTTVQMRPLNFGSFEQHVRDQRPTVAFVSFGMVEAFSGSDGLDSYLEGYSDILDILEKTGARIVMISPIRHENLGPPLPDPTPHNRNLRAYVDATAKLAAQRGHMFVDLFNQLGGDSDSAASPPLTENGIHLSDYGYWRAANAIADSLGLDAEPWQIHLNAATGQVKADGATVEDVQPADRVLRFKVTDTVLPNPAPPFATQSVTHAAPRTIRIVDLPPGRYSLKIDGVAVAAGSAAEWTNGVSIDNGPSFDRVQTLRQKINDRNQMFFFRWRAHNGEYIYGRRSASSAQWTPENGRGNSGNPTFDAEFAEFDRLIRQADQQINNLAAPSGHYYELSQD